MQYNEQLSPMPDQIQRMTAEIRQQWTSKEEYDHRVVKGDHLPVSLQEVKFPNVND